MVRGDTAPAVLVEGLEKSFGKVEALRGIDLEVGRGMVLGLLGPNGAGKTTTVRVLATLARPDAGRALVCGSDVVSDARTVRRTIALAGQHAAVDHTLTGRENLELVGGWFHLSRADRRRRAAEVVARLDLEEAAGRPVRTYSGGMRRRLDLGASLVADPEVVLLDEPTTGLDPRSRLAVWALIRDLARNGKTVLLTTQHLEEIDRLADEAAVIDHGRIVARDTPDGLKSLVGGDMVELTVSEPAAVGAAVRAVDRLGTGSPQVDAEAGAMSLAAGPDGQATLIEAIRCLDRAGIALSGVTLRRPSLDEAFLALTDQQSSDHELAKEGRG